MKQLNLNLLGIITIMLILLSSCSKEEIMEPYNFNLDEITGRYVFDIDVISHKNDVEAVEYFESVGYIRKVNDRQIKILFDVFEPGIDCKYEYIVRNDGTFYSLRKGAGTRIGSFDEKRITLSEKIDLGGGNYKLIQIEGFFKKEN